MNDWLLLLISLIIIILLLFIVNILTISIILLITKNIATNSFVWDAVDLSWLTAQILESEQLGMNLCSAT